MKGNSLEVVFQWNSVPEILKRNLLPHIIYEQSLTSTKNFESNPSLDNVCNEVKMVSPRIHIQILMLILKIIIHNSMLSINREKMKE